MGATADRRKFLKALAAVGGAVLAMPGRLAGFVRGPGAEARMPGPDADWQEIRNQFLIPRDEAFFNTGTLGSSPRVVLEAVMEHMTHVDRDIAHWDYKEGHENYFTGYYPELWLREKLGRLINAGAHEIALTQNATFGMNFMAHGLDLGPGDEVLMTDQEHPGGRCGWELKGKRLGVAVKYLKVPIPPEAPEQLVELYVKGTTPQTRVWAIPHLTSTLAIRFPVEELCAEAARRGIVTVIDGAQTCGHLAIDVRAMGCDAYFSSPHKWLLAPKGTGFLYVHERLHERVWTTLASAEWDNWRDGVYRLMQYGTGNLSLLVGLEKAVEFHLSIGPKRIEERIVGLADRLRAGLAEIPRVRIWSPTHPRLRSATTVWAVDGLSAVELQDLLWERGRVRCRAMGDPYGVRQCCHIYNSEEEVDRTLEVVQRYVNG